MNQLLFILILVFSFGLKAESKLSLDVSINSLQYQKPNKGVGRAGTLIFSNANVNNNGIVLNINNINNLFDSQIFVRPTFLGFTTQFGNYGLPLENDSVVNAVKSTELKNTKLVLDDNQLNIGGELLNFTNTDLDVKLKNFRLYCQNPNPTPNTNSINNDAPSSNMMKNCFSFLTLNGSFIPNNDFANIELENLDSKSNENTYIQTQVYSFDLRKNLINANLGTTKIVSNNNYEITANGINLVCAKDEDLSEIDPSKIKKACTNNFKLNSTKINLIDKNQKTNFNLDLKGITIKEKLAYMALNSVLLSDTKSTTSIHNLILNCKKDTETDIFDLMQVLNDCIDYARISLDEVDSSKSDSKNSNTSVKKIIINSTKNSLVTQAEVKFLGITARVAIYGTIKLELDKKQLILQITDTKLPFGINSVKLLMYILKKNLISKDIKINDNIITISL